MRMIKKVIDGVFVNIPKGTVYMRDDRTKVTWSVDIDPFELLKFPVTQEIYKVVTDKDPSTFKGDRLPVEAISWIDTVKFCNKLSLYLGRDK